MSEVSEQRAVISVHPSASSSLAQRWPRRVLSACHQQAGAGFAARPAPCKNNGAGKPCAFKRKKEEKKAHYHY